MSRSDFSEEIQMLLPLLNKQVAERVVRLASAKNGRKKFLEMLAHRALFDEGLAVGCGSTAREVEKELLAKGASGRCYAISETSRIDRQEMQLANALDAAIGSGLATILVAIPQQLVFFEPENGKSRKIYRTAKVS